jgi:hypothetical protein
MGHVTYSIRRDGKRWLVFRGWELMASFSTKAECQEYISLLKEAA